MLTKSPYFCVLPWYSREIVDWRETSCCLLPLDHDLEKLQRDLLNGTPSEYCQKCWVLEKSGKDSRRIQENRFLDFKLDRDIGLLELDCAQGKNQEIMYQIYLSNLCNQACTTCGPQLSTKWIELYRQSDLPLRVERKTLELDKLNLKYADAKRFYIVGGEPLFDPALIDLLQNLLDHNNTDCFISFVTNGSVKLSPKLKNLLENFTDLNMCISIDGVGKRFEYLRWPGRWDNLLENLSDYQQVTKNNISISYTLSSVNALYYKETIQWFEDQNLRYNHNIVYTPNWASLERLPVEIKNELIGLEFFSGRTEITGKEMPLLELYNELKKQDAMKKIDVKNYMPELARLFDLHLKI